MIDIVVQRGEVGAEGPEVVDPLLNSMAAALARGTCEIDKSSPARPMQMTINTRLNLNTGQLVQVMDTLQGVVWWGKIEAVDTGIEGVEQTTRLRISRAE